MTLGLEGGVKVDEVYTVAGKLPQDVDVVGTDKGVAS